MATTTYLRLFPAVKQFELKNGALNVGGRLFVYYEGTDDLAEIRDENGTVLQQPAILDNDGRALGLFVDSKKVYRLEVQDAFGAMQFTVRKMAPSGGGAGSALGKTYEVVSNDGSILVDTFDEGGTTTFDLSLGIDANELKPSCLRASAAPVTTDGQFVFDELVREGNLLSVDQSGKVRMEPAWYHFTAIVELSYDGTPVNEAHQVTLWTTLSNSVIDLDTSYAHRESIELSGDIHVVGNNTEFPLGVSGLDTGITASLMSFDIHAVTGHEGNNEYHAGEGITIVNATKTISADFDSVQEKLVAGENISITGNVISAGNLTQEQSDWTEDDTASPAYIKNKPDLDIYATQAQLSYGLAGKQDVIPDLAAIRSGAQAGASAVQPADLANVATTGDYNDLNNRPNLTVYATKTEVNTGLATKQDVISDLSAIRAGAQAGSTAVQPAALDSYATKVELNTGLSGKQDTINDLSTIRSGATAGATALQPSDVATVATTGDYDDLSDKPDLSVYATTQAMNTALAGKQDTISDLSTIRSGAAAGATAIQPGDLATVATTGSYDDLSDKPTIPAAQVNSDWNSVSGVSQILNKPSLAAVATTGDYDDLVNKPSIPAAQVNADWNASSGVAEILNKPANLVQDANYVHTDENFTSAEKTKLSGIAAGAEVNVQANWTESDSGSDAYIANKPALATVATTGAYSDLTGTPTINNVPAVTSSDNDKVLKASYSGGVGSYSWQTEQGGGSTYTAGDAIEIDNDEINVLYDSDTLELKSQEQTFTYALGTWDENYGRAYAQTTSDISDILEGTVGWELTLHIPANTFYINGTYGENIVLRISDDPYFGYSNYCLTPLAVTYDSVENKTWIDEQDIVLHTPTQDPDYWYISTNSSAQYVAFGPISSSNLCTITSVAAGNNVTVTFTHAGGDPLLAVKNPLPASAIGDATKVLTVNSNGDPAWAAPASATVDQVYNASSSNAQSGTAVAGAISGINQVPASTSSDADKVLTVDAQGIPGWANAQAPISAGDGIDITNNVVAAKVDGTTIDTNASGELTVIGGDDGADWDAEQGEPGYIENKPVPKTLTAGTGISITENQSTITIANTAPDTVASLPTNLTAAQIQAFKEALGVDETLLWSGVALDATMSELPTNFERIRIEFGTPVANTGDNIGRGCIEVSMAYVDTSNNGSIFLSTFFNGDGSNNNPYYTSGFVIGIRTLTWQTAWTAFGQVFGTTKSTGNSWFRLNKVVGIHRIASN